MLQNRIIAYYRCKILWIILITTVNNHALNKEYRVIQIIFFSFLLPFIKSELDHSFVSVRPIVGTPKVINNMAAKIINASVRSASSNDLSFFIK
jgi:hypothetical protein